jgi:predicted O-methyltransferase YrrM
MNELFERLVLSAGRVKAVEGSLRMDPEIFSAFLKAPHDLCPDFQGPAGSTLKGGRGKDHPRYGRFIYALCKTLKPERVVEVGTYAGGTAVGWCTAMRENKRGQLICIDNDTYSKNTYPAVTRANLKRVGADESPVELLNGDSRQLVQDVAARFLHAVDIYLVDGDHTFEGALRDMENGLPMVKSGGYMLVHDVDRDRRMDKMTPDHTHPVYEAFMQMATTHRLEWCILKFIRKHLGVLRIPT